MSAPESGPCHSPTCLLAHSTSSCLWPKNSPVMASLLLWQRLQALGEPNSREAAGEGGRKEWSERWLEPFQPSAVGRAYEDLCLGGEH